MKQTYKGILMTLLGKWDANGILGMKVEPYLLEFLHLSLNLHVILQKVYQLWVISSKVNEDLLLVLPAHPKKFNLNREVYHIMRSPQNDSVKIKPPDKGSSVVVWDRLDYLKEVEPQLSDSSISIRKLKLLKKILWI